MKIEELFIDKNKLEESYQFYLDKKIILVSSDFELLKKAHLEKAKHNLEFSNKISDFENYKDWIIVSLYYTLYHSFLALVENKGYSSKNYNATIVFVLKNYMDFDKEELKLFDNLKISEDDAKFYSNLKEKRTKASYSTNIDFNNYDIDQLIKKVKLILLKINNIIENS